MIKASLLLVLAYCASKLLRRQSAAERHLLWISAIVSAALLPLLGLLLPELQLQVSNQIAAAVLPKASHTEQAENIREGTVVHAYGIEPTGKIEVILFLAWASGSLVSLLSLAAGSRTLRRFAYRSQPFSDPALLNSVAELKRMFGLKRTIHLMESGYGAMPLTCGVFSPRVFLPRSSAEWSDTRTFVVLAHELAHVRRLDWLVQVVAELACAVYWFHPLFWIARNQLCLEAERACDDVVLRLGIEGQDYATHILDVARSLKKCGPAWSLAMARQLSLEKRLVAVLNPAVNRRALAWQMSLTILLAVTAITVPLAALSASTRDDRRDVSSIADGNQTRPSVAEYTTPPLYSDEARSRGIEGTVTVEVRVSVSGKAKDLHVIRGLGLGLDENALLAVRDWKFVPARRNGEQIEARTEVVVEFNLRNAELNEDIANDMATRVGPGVVPPRIVHRVEPRFERRLSLPRPPGTVLLDAVIQENGIPKVVRVLRSQAWEIDESAIAALEQWRFSPAMKNGMPIKVRMNVEMTFDPTKI